jgi:TPR repeat protein
MEYNSNEQDELLFYTENEVERDLNHQRLPSMDVTMDMVDIYMANKHKGKDAGEKAPVSTMTEDELNDLYHQILFQKDKVIELETIVFSAPPNVLTDSNSISLENDVFRHHFLAKAFLMAMYANDVANKLNRSKAKVFARELKPLVEKTLDSSPENILKFYYYFLGIYYTMNLGGENTPDVGVEFFEKSLSLGYHYALCNLGICAIKGNGVPKDEKKGFHCFQKSAARGYAGGQHNLAICYEKGLGVAKNPYEALKYEKLSADQGFLNAIYHLATYHESGFGLADEIQTTPDDPANPLESIVSHSSKKRANLEEAIRLYLLAANLGHDLAQYIIASYYEKGKSSVFPADPMEAFKWYFVCAEKGNPLAQYKVSYFYEHGLGCPLNELEAFKWCLKSAEQNDFISQNILGTYYEKGTGTDMNFHEAVYWYRKSAEQGYSNAQYNLGRCLLKGMGVSAKKPEEGLRWHRLCGNQGEYLAQKSVYHCYKHTIGCEFNEHEMEKWHKLVQQQKERLSAAGKSLPLKDLYVSRRQTMDEQLLRQHQSFVMLSGVHKEENDNVPVPPPPVLPTSPSPKHHSRRRTSSADTMATKVAGGSSLLTSTAQGKIFKRKNINDNREYALKYIPILFFTYKAKSASQSATSLRNRQNRRRSTSNVGAGHGSSNKENRESFVRQQQQAETPQSSRLKDENYYTSNFHLLQEEIDHLTEINHKHVLGTSQNFFQKIHAERYFVVVHEYIDYQGSQGNTLKKKMKTISSIHYNIKCLWLKQCLDALTYLHEKGIHHLNLSLDCIYFVSDHHLKLTDITLKNLLFIPPENDSESPREGSGQDRNTMTTFTLPLVPSLLMKKIIHYQKSHCYLSYEKISLFMTPQKKSADHQNQSAASSANQPGTSRSSFKRSSSQQALNRISSPESKERDPTSPTGGGGMPIPSIVIPPMMSPTGGRKKPSSPSSSFLPTPTNASSSTTVSFQPTPPTSPLMASVTTVTAMNESDLLDGGRDDFWTLGCLFAEVLLGYRLKDLISTSFELFHINEDHHTRKETLLLKIVEKEKEIRLSNENSAVEGNPAEANSISYGLLSQFIESAWKYSSERKTLKDYYRQSFLPSFIENPFLVELNKVELQFDEPPFEAISPVSPVMMNGYASNSASHAMLPMLSASASPRVTRKSLGGVISANNKNPSPTAVQISNYSEEVLYYTVEEEEQHEQQLETEKEKIRKCRPSFYEDEKHTITSDMMNEIYEYVRLNKMKLKKLEKLAYKKNSMIAKGFLMTLFLCDSQYYDYHKAVEISQEIIDWLREKEAILSAKGHLLIDHEGDVDAINEDDEEKARFDENIEYILFFLGVYHAFELFRFEKKNLKEENQITNNSTTYRATPPTEPNNDNNNNASIGLRRRNRSLSSPTGDRDELKPPPIVTRRERGPSEDFAASTSRLPEMTSPEEHNNIASSPTAFFKSLLFGPPSATTTSPTKRVVVTPEVNFNHSGGVDAAVPFFLQAIEYGYLVCQNNIGVCYASAIGVTKNYDEAFKWFHMAAKDGHELGQYNLGLCYEKGFGCRIDKIEAFRLFSLSSEQGCSLARCKLGECFENGIGVTKSYSEAMRWYRLSADQGNAKGQFLLGQCYEKGKGCSADLEMAMKWYKLGAEQGYNVAQYTLALCYENQGEKEEAQKWYEQNLVEKPFYPIHQTFVM